MFGEAGGIEERVLDSRLVRFCACGEACRVMGCVGIVG